MTTAQDAAPVRQSARADGGPVGYKWIASAVVMLGAVMVILDQTVVNVALPSLEADFQVPLSGVQWIVTGYTLALAAVMPLTGWLIDRYGSKRTLVTSQVLFVTGSVLCGLAWSNDVLIGFRVLQGLGGGLILPVGMATLMSITRPDERGRIMSVLGVPMLIAPAVGPTLGGWLIQAVSWRLIFFINLPIGIAAVLAALLLLRADGSARAKREPLDIGGLVLASSAVVGLVYGLSQPGTYGWDSVQTLAPLVSGAGLLVAFSAYELRRRHPLIDIRIFRDGAFRAALSLNFLVALTLFGAMILLPLFLQQVQGYTPLDSGLIIGAQGLGAALMMPISGTLTDRIGARWVVLVGLLLLVASTLWMTTLAYDTSSRTIVAMLVLRGMGMGFCMMPSMSAAYVTMAPDLIAHATSVANVVQRVASGVGVAIMTTVLSARIAANLPALPAGTPAPGASNLASAHLATPIKHLLLQQTTKGFDDTFWVAAGLTLLAFPLALLLRRALRREEVRAYALRQLAGGVVLGAAARRLRDAPAGSLSHELDSAAAVPVIAGAALARLHTGLVLLRAGTGASGLVPRPGPSLGLRLTVGLAAAVAVFGMVAASAYGLRASPVPQLPRVTVQAATSSSGGAQR
jgi:EmrB/QacA subfamily drug resistance transporter